MAARASFAVGYAVFHEKIIPYGINGQVLEFIAKHKAGGEITLNLGLVDKPKGLKQGGQNSLAGSAQTDSPGGNAVDGGIKVVKTHGNSAVEVSAAHFLHYAVELIVLNNDMVVVPSYAAADVQHNGIYKVNIRAELIRYALGGVEVTGVKAYAYAVLFCGIAKIEFMAAHGEAFHADCKELALRDIGGIFFLFGV